MSGKPSQLARTLINDMCTHKPPLDGCCFSRWIYGLWHRSLPSSVKQAVAHHSFNKDSLNTVLALADKVYESTRPSPAIAAIQAPLDEGFHPDWPSQAQEAAEYPEVAAISRGRGRGRGGRGGQRGRGANQAQTASRPFYSKDNPRWTNPRHPDLPPFHVCKKHWIWGKSCHKCDEPNKCPWRKFITPRANN